MTSIRTAVFAFLFLNAVKASHAQKTTHYDLFITDTVVNYTGKKVAALAINGSIPAPALYFTEGDTAEIIVHNFLHEETSVHWHGLILPNQYDGVPYLTTAPIKPGESHTYRFPLVQSGTYWYHSHTKLQEQKGMYGAFIIYPRSRDTLPDFTVVLSDWSNMNPDQIHRGLHNATDWFAIRKQASQNYFEAARTGYLGTKLTNEWKRMLPMDVSDVYYERFLANGNPSDEIRGPAPGKPFRLRVVNGSSSTYFWLRFAGGRFKVVASDGMDVVPVEVDRMIIGVAETYDLVITIPDTGAYELLATSEDRTGSASVWLGEGTKHFHTALPKLKYFEGMKMMNGMMKMNGGMDDMGMNMSNQVMDMNTVMYPEITGFAGKAGPLPKLPGRAVDSGTSDMITLNYGMLRSPVSTRLKDAPVRLLVFELTGNMSRYVWSINGKTVSESDKIMIRKGENIRIVIHNNSMMRHPMHLHGHFFRVLNGAGDHSPLKNVLDIMPMETDTIEFEASESGDWFFHCHILYHMMSGMGRIFSYENSPPNPELPDPKRALRKVYSDDREFHAMAKVGIETNGSDGEAMLANTRWKLETMWHLGYHDMHGYENETMLGRYFGNMQWWYAYAGFDYHYKTEGGPENIFGSEDKNWLGQNSNKLSRRAITFGVAYTLPMLVIADVRMDSDLKFRVQLSREDMALTSRLRLNWMINTDKEYILGLRYVVTRYISLSSHYDSDMGLGVGLTFLY